MAHIALITVALFILALTRSQYRKALLLPSILTLLSCLLPVAIFYGNMNPPLPLLILCFLAPPTIFVCATLYALGKVALAKSCTAPVADLTPDTPSEFDRSHQ